MKNYIEHIKSFDSNVKNTIIFSFFFNLANAVFNVIYNLYLLKMNFNEESIGKIISAGSLGVIIFSFLSIFFASKLGYKKHMIIFLIFSSIFNLSRILIINQYLYWLNVLASGTIFSMSVLVYPLIIGSAKKESLTYAFGLNFFVSWLALTIGNLIGGYLPEIFKILTFNTIFSYRATLVMGTMFMTLSIIPITKLKISANHKSQYLSIEKITKIFKDKEDLKIMERYFIISFVIGLAAGLFVPFFNVILKATFNMNSGNIGIIMAISQILTAIGGIIGPLIAEKIGRVKTVVLLNMISIPFLIIMALTDITAVFLTSFLLRNIFMNMGEPVSSSFILSNIKDDKKIVLNSLVSVFFQLGWFIQAPIAGNFMIRFGYSFVFILAASIYSVRALLYYVFFKNSDKTFTVKNQSL